MNKKEELIVDLSKPYNFEGKKYTKLDFSNLEKLSTRDLCEVQSILEDGGTTILPEANYEFQMHIAARATGLPVEFFFNLPATDGVSVKGVVMKYFFA